MIKKLLSRLPDKSPVPLANLLSPDASLQSAKISRRERSGKFTFPAENVLNRGLVLRDDRDFESADRAVHIPVLRFLCFHPGQVQLVLNLFRRLRIPAVKRRPDILVFHIKPPSGEDPVRVLTQRTVVQQAELSQPDHQSGIGYADPLRDRFVADFQSERIRDPLDVHFFGDLRDAMLFQIGDHDPFAQLVKFSI